MIKWGYTQDLRSKDHRPCILMEPGRSTPSFCWTTPGSRAPHIHRPPLISIMMNHGEARKGKISFCPHLFFLLGSGFFAFPPPFSIMIGDRHCRDEIYTYFVSCRQPPPSAHCSTKSMYWAMSRNRHHLPSVALCPCRNTQSH